MSNFKNLVDKIKNEAELKKEKIVSKARGEAAKLISKKVEEAHEYKEKLVKKAHDDGLEVREKIISKCDLNGKNQKLEAKRRVLDDVFNKAKEELINLDIEQVKEYLFNILEKLDLSGSYIMYVNDRYKSLDSLFLDNLSSKLKNTFKISEIKTSVDLKGGFILEKDGVFINYSFESQLNSIRDEIEFEISNLLFN